MPYRHHRYTNRIIPFYDKGPGPARYTLPPLLGKYRHDFTRHCYPEHWIAIKLRVGPFWHPETIGPGPAYNILFGQKAIGTPAHIKWTFPHKYPPNDIPYSVGPAYYHPKGVDVYRYKYPIWSLHYKHKILKKGKHPSPTDHDLGVMLGPKISTRTAAMECTMKGDRKDRTKKGSPGPIYEIGDPLKKKVPAWEIGRRWNLGPPPNGDLGPGYYDPLYTLVEPLPPRVEMGRRYNAYTGVLKTACDNL